MREVNFSIPNGNKASVYITPTLYDRRALDCTSTLPLINSLNHLAYLTTSSARIRDILTVDGGVERLVCILKEGRSRDEYHMWKWNLAFQCVVNIGVRGTEPVRTRVVEADMVPVIATILHDYILVIEKERQRYDSERQRHPAKVKTHTNAPRSARLPRDLTQEQQSRSSFLEHQMSNLDNGQARRQAPPRSLELAPNFADRFTTGEPSQTAPLPPLHASTIYTSPPERTTFPRPILQHQTRSHDGRNPFQQDTIAGSVTSTSRPDIREAFPLQPVRDADRLPSMMPPILTGITSNPNSPTTPSAPLVQSTISPNERRLRRPSIRQQPSTDDVLMDDVNNIIEETIAEQEARDDNDRNRALEGDITPRAIHEDRDPLSLTIPGTLLPEQDNVDIAQQTPTAATALESLLTQAEDTNGVSPGMNGPQPTASPVVPFTQYTNVWVRTATSNSAIVPLMPRDDDVLLGLQLLAYISKYCDLRHYFQATHLVPRLRIDHEVERIYNSGLNLPEPTEDELEEYLQLDDVNIFPLVEKFTIPHHPKDMQYWACVVMRNLCRKDDARGGTRQCANYKCGKWEEYPRQFAKCRRCKRTKYCSKECQRDSWTMHRHWCQTTP
ncbi:hypothetical protein LTR51_001236 [Lithohypha guttulata]|nr:hypothetical protein LTR51_001236 [Lithohypha guttulata]